MTESFKGLRDIIQVYMDDMIVHSKVLSNHHIHLRAVFRRCQSNGIRLRLSKCEFLKEELNLLGYVVAKEGIKKNLDKIAPILNYGKKAAKQARLFTIAQVRSFVGMCQWYRGFHHMFADHILVLTDLLKKGKSVKKDWGLDHQTAFDSLKTMVAEQTLLYYPDEDALFVIMTDASKFAIGGALMQLQTIVDPTDNSTRQEWRVVEYFSRSLIERERHYTVTEKEFLAIVSCVHVERWKHFLWKSFRVITDHKPLLAMSLTEKARLLRWALRLTPYSFDLAWAPGEEMVLPDALSRDPGLEQGMTALLTIIEPEKKEEIVADQLLVPVAYTSENREGIRQMEIKEENPLSLVYMSRIEPIHTDETTVTVGELTVRLVKSRVIKEKEDCLQQLQIIHTSRLEHLEELAMADLIQALRDREGASEIVHPGSPSFRHEQEMDPVLKGVIDRLERGETVEGYYIQKESNLLMTIRKGRRPGIVVPEQSESNLLWLYHEHPLAGHASSEKLVESMAETFHMRGARQKAVSWVKNCQCRRAKARMRRKAGLTLARPIPRLFAYLILDLVGPFPRSRRGNIYWLTMLDAFSKDLELVPLKSKKADEIAKAILKFWVCRRGCPISLLSDNARELIGSIAESLCKLLHIHKSTITAYSHTSAGLIERIHNYAHSIMRASNVKNLSQWDEKLPFIRFAILTHELDGTGVSPFQITYGIQPTLPGDLTAQNHLLPKSMRKYMSMVHKAMTHTREYFRVNRQKARIKNRLKRDRLNKRFRQVFQKGEPVYVTKPSYTRRDGVKGLSKIVGPFRGPYQIVEVDSTNGVDVAIDGEIQHFNVGQTAEAYTLHPLDRQPPAYQEDRLVYQPELGEGKSVERGQKPSDDSDSKEFLPSNILEDIPEEVENIGKEAELHAPRPKQTQKSVRGEEKEIKPKKNYQIIFDKVSGTFYASELLDDESGQPQAALYRAAKKGQYHKIWYNPEDANITKTQKNCPKGYQPWTIPLDDTWEKIGPVVNKLKDLSRKIVSQQSLDPI